MPHKFTYLPFVFAIIVAVAVGGVPNAQAQAKNAAKAKKEFELGWNALQAENYESALGHYQRSYALAPRPRTLFNIAVSEEKLGRINDAVRHYLEFLDSAEKRDADFKRQAEKKVKALSRLQTSTLRVVSDPPGASVFVNGSNATRGITPLDLELRAGTYALRLRMDGAKPTERTVTVSGQRKTTERFTLRRTSTVVITVEPSEALIAGVGDKRPTVAAKGYRRRVDPGTHQFTVALEGYREQTVTVEALAGRIHERHVHLLGTGGTGALRIHSRAAGARVSIDGIVVGTTKTSGSKAKGGADLRQQLDVGDHDVIVERDGAQAWHRRLHVSPGEEIRIDLDFRDTQVSRTRALTWGLVGLGTVSIAAGTTLGVLALRDVSGTDADAHARGKTRALVTDVLIVGGAAAILGAWRLSTGPETSARVRRAHTGN